MGSIKILAILFLLGGSLGLAYSSFSVTTDRHEAKIGPLELSVEEKERVNIPQWMALAAIGGGALMLLLDRSRA